jgi:hypothetical protein
MVDVSSDCFVVFVRHEPARPGQPPETVEHAVATCASYEEALRVRRELHGAGKTCIIRSVGQAGGED